MPGQRAEMRFLRHVSGYALQDRRRNVDVRQELNIKSILDRIAQYRLNWWEHLCRMDDCRIPKQLWLSLIHI